MTRIAVGWLLVAGLGCAPMTVHHDYDPDVDFSRYRTFSWMPLSPEQVGTSATLSGPFLEKRIKKSIAEGLTAGGLAFVTEQPDLLVAYQLRYRNRSHVRVGGYGYMHAGYPHRVDVSHSREGTLIVDLVDPLTKGLIWRGWAVSDVHRAGSPEDEQERIDLAVRKLLERYPPYGKSLP